MTSRTAPAVPFLDDDVLLGQRAALAARRRAYHEQVERLLDAFDELAEAEPPDLGDDQGFAEADPISVERDRIVSLAAMARRRLEEVDAALARLDAGTYGRCQTCGRSIPVPRLEAVPEATQCVSCASGPALRRR
jgi:RNA polymerase-binding transcription factor